MGDISLSGSGEGPGRVTAPGCATAGSRARGLGAMGGDGAGRALGFGCQPGGIEVEDGVRADVTITVDENPDPDRGRPCPRQ